MKATYRVENRSGYISVTEGDSNQGSSANTVAEIKRIASRVVAMHSGSAFGKSSAREQIALWTKADIEDGTATAEVY